MAGVDFADVMIGDAFCSPNDGNEWFVCVNWASSCISVSFRRATAFSLAKQISIEEQTVVSEICWLNMVLT